MMTAGQPPGHEEQLHEAARRSDGLMVRRKAYAYVMIMMCGITAAYFLLERYRPAAGVMMLIIPGIMIFMLPLGTSDDRHTRLVMILMLVFGFMNLTCHYIASERYADTGHVYEIEGRVVSVTVSVGSCRMVIAGAGTPSYEETDRPTPDLGRVQAVIYSSSEVDRGEAEENSLDPVYQASDLLGRHVRMSGELSMPDGADNPGCFDYRIYLKGKSIRYVFTVNDLATLEDDKGPSETAWRIRRYLARIREDFLASFDDDMIRGFIKGVIFGDRSDLDEDIEESFSQNSTGHILAVSGLHVGFLYALLRAVSGRRRSLPVSLVIITVLIMYGEMTQWSASTIRAVIVMSIGLMAVHLRGRADLLTSVSAAAFVILTAQPYQLFSSGFQLSFMALVSIAFLAKPLSVFTGEGLGVMLSVQAGTAPLSAYLFHRLNVMAVLINIPVIALASVLVPVCIVLLGVSTVTGWVPGIGVMLVSGLSEMIIRINGLLAADGIFSDLVISVNAGILASIYMSLFMLASEWMRVRILRRHHREAVRPFICIIILSMIVGAGSFNRFADDEVVFVAVGQGDCVHVRADGRDILIDGGGSVRYNVGEKILLPYLLANGAENVELAAVTHLHTDHYKGIFELDEVYPVGAVGIPSDYRRSVEEAGERGGGDVLPGNILFTETGQRINVSEDVYIEPVWPLPGGDDISIDDPNEHNMVYMVNYRGIRILVTGDLLAEDETEMLRYYRHAGMIDMLQCDILKVGHHGSKTSSSEEFLDAVDPDIAVIQVGRGNTYGHPHQQTLDRLEERGIAVYRTDLNGAIGIDIGRDGNIHVDYMKQIER